MNRVKMMQLSETCFWFGMFYNTIKGAYLFASGDMERGAFNVLLGVMCVVGIGFVSARRKEMGDG